MRSRAEAVTCAGAPDYRMGWYDADDDLAGALIKDGLAVGPQANDDAVHIASWHPAVALAVADWLDTAGADLWAHGPLCCEAEYGCDECDGILWMQHVRRALTVARAYLGSDA